jgi:predicted nucleic acid-binding protein
VERFVLDASVALSWLFRDEETPASMAIHAMTDDHRVVVPPHWFAEMANGIRQGERRERCASGDAPAFLSLLGLLDYELSGLAPFDQFAVLLPLAREHDLTVYDAAYLHCAISRGLPLATFDQQLATAARACNVTIIGDSA